MKWLFPVFLYLLSLCTGALFLYSAYTKLFPIQSFEYTITEFLHVSSRLAGIAARFFTALEAGLGALMVFQFYGGKKWVLNTAFALVVLFSLFLIWLWAKEGNSVNCGCFGDAIWMSPSVSLVKNAALLVAIWLLLRFHSGFSFKWINLALPVFLVSVLVSVYFFFPFFKIYKIDLTPVYADTANAPRFDLAKGKHIIAFLSPSCIHCRRAALKIHNMEAKDSTLPIYMIIGGVTGSLKDFWDASKAEGLPHSRLASQPFMKYTGGVFPTILWVNNGMVEANTNYTELDPVVIKKWMR